jgi:hypothetical protein
VVSGLVTAEDRFSLRAVDDLPSRDTSPTLRDSYCMVSDLQFPSSGPPDGVCIHGHLHRLLPLPLAVAFSRDYVWNTHARTIPGRFKQRTFFRFIPPLTWCQLRSFIETSTLRRYSRSPIPLPDSVLNMVRSQWSPLAPSVESIMLQKDATSWSSMINAPSIGHLKGS